MGPLFAFSGICLTIARGLVFTFVGPFSSARDFGDWESRLVKGAGSTLGKCQGIRLEVLLLITEVAVRKALEGVKGRHRCARAGKGRSRRAERDWPRHSRGFE